MGLLCTRAVRAVLLERGAVRAEARRRGARLALHVLLHLAAPVLGHAHALLSRAATTRGAQALEDLLALPDALRLGPVRSLSLAALQLRFRGRFRRRTVHFRNAVADARRARDVWELRCLRLEQEAQQSADDALRVQQELEHTVSRTKRRAEKQKVALVERLTEVAKEGERRVGLVRKQLREADIVLCVSDLLGCNATGRAASFSKSADRDAKQTSQEASKEAVRAQERLAEYERPAQTGVYYGIESSVVSPAEAKKIHPLLNVDDVYGGIYSPTDGTLDPAGLTNAYAKAAKGLGARVVEGIRVASVGTEGIASADGTTAQRVTGVTTECGQTVKATHVINACGSWAGPLSASVGAPLPLLAMKHAYVVTEGLEEHGMHGGLPNVRVTIHHNPAPLISPLLSLRSLSDPLCVCV